MRGVGMHKGPPIQKAPKSHTKELKTVDNFYVIKPSNRAQRELRSAQLYGYEDHVGPRAHAGSHDSLAFVTQDINFA